MVMDVTFKEDILPSVINNGLIIQYGHTTGNHRTYFPTSFVHTHSVVLSVDPSVENPWGYTCSCMWCTSTYFDPYSADAGLQKLVDRNCMYIAIGTI